MPRLNSLMLGLILLGFTGLASSGCAGSQQIKNPRYLLAVPDFWEVKAVSAQDGQATRIVVGQYGSAVIDEGVGSTGLGGPNYDRVTGDVEVRIFAWPDPLSTPGATPGPGLEPQEDVKRLLAADPELNLPESLRIPDRPRECNQFPRKYRIANHELPAVDLVKRPGFRIIVVGTREQGSLIGVVARVEFEQDMARYCHNLKNLQVQLQSLLDGLTPIAAPGAPVPVGAAVSPAAPP